MNTTTHTLPPRFLTGFKIIRDAQDAGVEIDAGNIVDLLADNLDCSLDECREIATALAERHPNIPAPKTKEDLARKLPTIDDTIQFRLKRSLLSDQSEVFMVEITHDVEDEYFKGTLDLHAISHAHAIKLQKKIWGAIKEHTNEPVEFFEEGF